MRTLYRLRSLVGRVIRRKTRRLANQFLAATNHCRQTQHEVLARLLELNGTSDFSREHRLQDVRNVADFRRQLPISNFEYFRPYVERLKQGQTQALLGDGNRLLMFTLSSGTTSESKFIPITQQFLDDYRRGWQIWGILAFTDHPGVFDQNIVQLSSDHERFHSPGGTPCGNISGLVHAMQSPVVRTMYSVPGSVAKISDPDAKAYASLRLALAEPHIGAVITANPSTLIHLAKQADAEKEQLIRDIADGTLSDHYPIDGAVRDKLRWRTCLPRPLRARRLRRIVETTGHLFPKDYWANLALVAVWTGGSVGAYLPTLRRYYGEVPIRDHGLSASEGRMTIPVGDGRCDGILDVTSHFFEFIPEEEYGSEQPTLLEADELEEGRNYYILLTTSSGLYRYDICDVVRCTGFRGTTPMLAFLHKGAHISNVTGEKVSESQVVAAVRDCIEGMQIHLDYFTVSPVWGEPPGYQLLVEEQNLPARAVGDGLARGIDAGLQRLNCEYQEKRSTGRLAPLKCVLLPDGTWKRFVRQRQSSFGGSVEQYKHPCLIPDLEFTPRFLSEFAQPVAREGMLSGPHIYKARSSERGARSA